jgi:hypothetical protein
MPREHKNGQKPDLQISGAPAVNIPGLVIDTSDMSWGDFKTGYFLKRKLEEAQKSGDAALIEAAITDMEKLLARVVKAVPRDWLISTAPDEIDWSDYTNFSKWLKGDRFEELAGAYGSATTPSKAAKN